MVIDECIFKNIFGCRYMDKKSLYLMYKDKKWAVWEVEEFTNSIGLLADPTRYIRNHSKWSSPKTLDVYNLIEKLQKHFILINDEKTYLEKFQNKKSILDYNNFGNFHEQFYQGNGKSQKGDKRLKIR